MDSHRSSQHGSLSAARSGDRSGDAYESSRETSIAKVLAEAMKAANAIIGIKSNSDESTVPYGHRLIAKGASSWEEPPTFSPKLLSRPDANDDHGERVPEMRSLPELCIAGIISNDGTCATALSILGRIATIKGPTTVLFTRLREANAIERLCQIVTSDTADPLLQPDAWRLLAAACDPRVNTPEEASKVRAILRGQSIVPALFACLRSEHHSILCAALQAIPSVSEAHDLRRAIAQGHLQLPRLLELAGTGTAVGLSVRAGACEEEEAHDEASPLMASPLARTVLRLLLAAKAVQRPEARQIEGVLQAARDAPAATPSTSPRAHRPPPSRPPSASTSGRETGRTSATTGHDPGSAVLSAASVSATAAPAVLITGAVLAEAACREYEATQASDEHWVTLLAMQPHQPAEDEWVALLQAAGHSLGVALPPSPLAALYHGARRQDRVDWPCRNRTVDVRALLQLPATHEYLDTCIASAVAAATRPPPPPSPYHHVVELAACAPAQVAARDSAIARVLDYASEPPLSPAEPISHRPRMPPHHPYSREAAAAAAAATVRPTSAPVLAGGRGSAWPDGMHYAPPPPSMPCALPKQPQRGHAPRRPASARPTFTYSFRAHNHKAAAMRDLRDQRDRRERRTYGSLLARDPTPPDPLVCWEYLRRASPSGATIPPLEKATFVEIDPLKRFM